MWHLHETKRCGHPKLVLQGIRAPHGVSVLEPKTCALELNLDLVLPLSLLIGSGGGGMNQNLKLRLPPFKNVFWRNTAVHGLSC